MEPCLFKPVKGDRCASLETLPFGFCTKHAKTIQGKSAKDIWEKSINVDTPVTENVPVTTENINESVKPVVTENIKEPVKPIVTQNDKEPVKPITQAPSNDRPLQPNQFLHSNNISKNISKNTSKNIEYPKEQKIVKVFKNRFGRYQDAATNLLFNKSTDSVYGVQLANGRIGPLTIKDKRICEINGWDITEQDYRSVSYSDTVLDSDSTSESFDTPIPDRYRSITPLPNRPLPNRPLPNRPVPNRPVPNRPVPNRPVPNRTVTDRPLLNRPVTDRPLLNRTVTDRPLLNRPVTDRSINSFLSRESSNNSLKTSNIDRSSMRFQNRIVNNRTLQNKSILSDSSDSDDKDDSDDSKSIEYKNQRSIPAMKSSTIDPRLTKYNRRPIPATTPKHTTSIPHSTTSKHTTSIPHPTTPKHPTTISHPTTPKHPTTISHPTTPTKYKRSPIYTRPVRKVEETDSESDS